MKTPIIVIPGYGGHSRLKAYRYLHKVWGAIIFTPNWKKGVIKDWIVEYNEFIKAYPKYIGIGFSVGAFILNQSNHPGIKNIYASMSPIFSRDKKKWPKKLKKTLPKGIIFSGRLKATPHPTFLRGEYEPIVSKTQRKTTIVKGAYHKLSDHYLLKISEVV